MRLGQTAGEMGMGITLSSFSHVCIVIKSWAAEENDNNETGAVWLIFLSCFNLKEHVSRWANLMALLAVMLCSSERVLKNPEAATPLSMKGWLDLICVCVCVWVFFRVLSPIGCSLPKISCTRLQTKTNTNIEWSQLKSNDAFLILLVRYRFKNKQTKT